MPRTNWCKDKVNVTLGYVYLVLIVVFVILVLFRIRELLVVFKAVLLFEFVYVLLEAILAVGAAGGSYNNAVIIR